MQHNIYLIVLQVPELSVKAVHSAAVMTVLTSWVLQRKSHPFLCLHAQITSFRKIDVKFQEKMRIFQLIFGKYWWWILSGCLLVKFCTYFKCQTIVVRWLYCCTSFDKVICAPKIDQQLVFFSDGKIYQRQNSKSSHTLTCRLLITHQSIVSQFGHHMRLI